MSRPPQRFAATAPVRLDLAGGWTDVPPFSTREGGAVVNVALTLGVRAELELGGEGMLLVAQDLQQAVRLAGPAGLAPDGRLDLHKAALRMFPVGPCTLRTRAEVPPGSGLGSSGALDVALVSVLAAARGETPTPAEVADHGWQLEVVEAGIAGGRQDQYAAALGGFHHLTFRDPDVTAERLALDAAFEAELARRLVLCYTGRSRVSGDTIRRVMDACERGDLGVTGALHRLREIADRMRAALLAADLAATGALLAENWAAQQRLDAGMCTPEMWRLTRAMSAAGALGGKAAGAGAGGCMFFLAGDDRAAALAAAEAAGATVLEAGWSATGVQPC